MVFYGSPAHPRGMGLLIRLCLGQGIEPWFIPCESPGATGWWRSSTISRRIAAKTRLVKPLF